MRPERTNSQAKRNWEVERCWLPIWRMRPEAWTASESALPSEIVNDAGYCKYTSFPAWAAATPERLIT